MTDEATRRQNEAADPARSVWLSANAGSGKTRVLTDRVARLLLDGAPPQNILCLTYTKAAAGEMQNRLFGRLGDWAMMADDTLRAALTGLGVAGPFDAARLAAARRLFAAAIEAPGGLKIQTIHAFCAALLRRFPREAGIAPGFTEMEDRARGLLIDEVLDGLATGPEAGRIDAVAAHLSQDDDLKDLIAGILACRAGFDAPMDMAACRVALGLPEDFDEAALLAESLAARDAGLLAILVSVLGRRDGNDGKAAEKLRPLLGAALGIDALPLLEAQFLYGETAKAPFAAKIGTFPTKDGRTALGADTMAALNDLMHRIEAARSRRLALASARRNAALHAFAATFLPRYDAAKAARGWLDFDDLIWRARALLGDPHHADWVLYRLDGAIDHILVDEAQDTSPAQWQIIALLARELTVGTTARSATPRTLFVVGDRKQSIYSFQGADPAEFTRMRTEFADRLAQIGQRLGGARLLHSFRSAPAILQVVDATFADAPPGLDGAPAHLAGRATLPGRVDLWPMLPRAKSPEAPEWYDPVDRTSPSHHDVQLARAIAREIRRLIDADETLPDGTGGRRSLTAGDVLILVQRRSGALFSALLAACKVERLEVAGADRLRLLDDLAVRDLLALLNFLALPEDDLSLAAALRSPLFGWSEDELYRLAQPRRGYLWAALRADPAHRETVAVLKVLRDAADFLRPHDLLDRILTRGGMRERLLARLGPDVEEAIDALLAEALAYERNEVPSLTGFLVWITAENAEVKRKPEERGQRLRIMTVHGAKGLEAPVVILPDCGPRDPRRTGPVLMTEAGWPAWSLRRAEAPPALHAAAEALRRRDDAERDRLLYVAMTRAECWLIVAAAGDAARAGTSWHGRVASGMARIGAAPLDTPSGHGLRHASGSWLAGPLLERAAPPGALSPPDWVATRPPLPPPRSAPLRPSDLGGAKALPGEGALPEDRARLRGTRLHLLLEHLPRSAEAGWPELARSLLGSEGVPPDPPEAEALLGEAIAVLTNPDLKPLFAAGALAEVAITADLPDLGGRIHGVIDRLVVAPDRVLAVDFKSNAVLPARPEAVPEGLLRQMGAYDAALRQIYPGHEVETAILWTGAGRLMKLPPALVAQALRTSDAPLAHLDAPNVDA